MDKLSERYGMTLPKGGGAPVDAAAREFEKKYGRQELKNVAKIHFRNYSKLDEQTFIGAM